VASTPDVAIGWPPGHYYSPIPSLAAVRRRESEIFDRVPGTIPGVDLRDREQAVLFEELTQYYATQPFPERPSPGRRYFFENPNYSYGEAIILYCLMRLVRPRRIVEIGSGYSSCAIVDTNELFFQSRIACTFVDPQPDLLVSLLGSGAPAAVTIVRQEIQDVGLDLFAALEPNDMLIVDSTHVSKVDSDVNHILFRVLPALASGVYVHFHDIYYPFEYPREWIYQGRAWTEAYLLRAFLQYNRAFEIVFFNSFFAHFHEDRLRRGMPGCLKGPGSSIWLRKAVKAEA